MNNTGLYSATEVVNILSFLASMYHTTQQNPCEGGDDLAKRVRQRVVIDGKEHWVTGENQQDIFNAYLKLCLEQGVVFPMPFQQAEAKPHIPTYGEYLKTFVKTYKSKQQSLTKQNREQLMKKHIIPRWGDCPLNEIKTSDLQLWLNELEAEGYSHETLLKLKNTMSPTFDSAMEDNYIQRNPLKSNRLVIGGRETVHHKAIPKEKMEALKEGIDAIEDERMKFMTALLAYTGMRFEEVLGLKWEDLDPDNGWLYINRAVVHPTRNQAEIKEPKTKTSKRRIPLSNNLYRHLSPHQTTGFILYSYDDPTRGTPLSYTSAKKCFDRIRKMFGLTEYTAHDFRDTCATEWKEAGMPLDVISHLLGHAKSDITETRYVKYRDELYDGVRAILES